MKLLNPLVNLSLLLNAEAPFLRPPHEEQEVSHVGSSAHSRHHWLVSCCGPTGCEVTFSGQRTLSTREKHAAFRHFSCGKQLWQLRKGLPRTPPGGQAPADCQGPVATASSLMFFYPKARVRATILSLFIFFLAHIINVNVV